MVKSGIKNRAIEKNGARTIGARSFNRMRLFDRTGVVSE